MNVSGSKIFVGRQILLIGIGFYDYEKAIAEELRRQGAFVLLYDELPTHVRRGMLASMLRRLKIDTTSLVHAHHKRILDEISGYRIDQVLVIKGEHMTHWFLDALRSAHNGVELIAYHWDSLTRYPHLLELQPHFDKVYTFDHVDAKRFPEFKFCPLFFRPEIANVKRPPSLEMQDLSFVGWLHHGRLRQINEIEQSASRQGLRGLFYLYTGWFSMMRLHCQGQGRFVKCRAMSYIDYVSLLHGSRVIVDLPHPTQTGLTMRSIEALGAGNKLITTASDIVKYDFYRSENIQVIDAEHPSIDLEFLSTPTVQLPADVVASYSLYSWVRELFYS